MAGKAPRSAPGQAGTIPSRTVRLDINLNGRNTSVDLASQGDVEKMIGILRQFKARS